MTLQVTRNALQRRTLEQPMNNLMHLRHVKVIGCD